MSDFSAGAASFVPGGGVNAGTNAAAPAFTPPPGTNEAAPALKSLIRPAGEILALQLCGG